MADVQNSPEVTYYRLARAVMARFVGAAIVGLAVLVFGTTLVVSALEAGLGWIVGVAVVGLIAAFVLGWWLRARAYVMRCSPQGYAVRMVRGAGAKEGRWVDVEEATTATAAGAPCLILKLKSGETTTVPVSILETDREQFVREIQGFLGKGTPRRRVR